MSKQPKTPRVYKPPYQRYRESDNLALASTSWAWWSVSPSGVKTYTVPWTNSSAKRLGEFRSMTDVVTPAYQVRQADGGIINSPMNQRIETTWGSDTGWAQHYSGQDGSSQHGESTGNWVITYLGAPSHLSTEGVPDSWLTEAATKVVGKLDQSSAQITTTLLKLRQNVGLLAGAGQRLGNYIRTFARGKNSSRSDAAANAWLEGRYGWRVFLREMQKYLDAIARGLNEVTRETARASVSGQIGTWTVSGSIGIGVGAMSHTTTTTATGRVRCGILHQHSEQTWRDIVGFRWSDIPYSAWDLIPYSFVLNWFLNIDVLLRTLSAVSVTRLAEWTVVETIHTTTRVHGQIPPVGSGWVVDRHPMGSEVRVTVERTRFPHVRNPGIVVKQGALSFLQDPRLLDTIALITQAVRRR